MSNATVENLKQYLEKMNQYEHVMTLLNWDMETTMPKLGFEGHARALTYFSTELFKLSTTEELGKMLEELSSPKEYEKLNDMWKFVVKRMKRDYDESRRIPQDFFEQFVQAKSESGNAWKEAKRASDFSIYAPHLEKVIEMTKKMAEYTNPGEEVYNVLLNQYEE